jgi:hypothetical protein
MALPLTGAALSLPALAHAGDRHDPVLPHYRQWVSARAEWLRLTDLPGNGNYDAPESMAEEDKEQTAFRAMCEETPTSMEGIAALAHALWDLDGPVFCPDHEDYEAATNSQNCKLIAAIWRAASGQTGLPV